MFQISLRQLLILVAAIALAIASLRFANSMWLTWIRNLVIAVALAAAIYTVVGRGSRRIFAAGFLATMCFFMLVSLGQEKLFANPGPPLTTRLLQHLHEAVAERHWYDAKTAKPIPAFDPAQNGPQAKNAYEVLLPDIQEFVPIAQYWLLLLSSCLGGCLASLAYQRRTRGSPATEG